MGLKLNGLSSGYVESSSGLVVPRSYLDTDGTLAANSDSKVATQKAVKTYVDAEAAARIALLGLWRDVDSQRGAELDALTSDRVLLLDLGTTSGSTTSGRAAFYFDPADYLLSGFTTKMRVVAMIASNDVAPAANMDVLLRPVSGFSGAATAVSAAVGAAIATALSGTINADSVKRVVSAEINAPAAGAYLFYVDIDNSMAASSSVVVRAKVQIRYV